MTVAEAKAHEEKISAQLHEAKALIDQVEAHAKKNKAEAQIEKINKAKAKKEAIEKKWHQHLKAAGAAAVAIKIKNDVEADLAQLKSFLQETAAQLESQAQAAQAN
jgi:hypothetical protein